MHDPLRPMRVLEQIRIEALKSAVALTAYSQGSTGFLADDTEMVLERAKKFEDYILVITK
jgi:hypothetical protein